MSTRRSARCPAAANRAPPTATPRSLGYHPILATRADTGEILHARMRKGSANTARGARRFCDELVARLRRAGAAGPIVIRFDSGFWSAETIKTLGRHSVCYTMAVRTNTPKVAAVIADIDEDGWVDIDYTPDGHAQVAESVYDGRRLIVRRTRLTDTAQARLWPDWRHFGFLTDLTGPTPSRSTRSTGPMPPSSSPSATSKKAPASSTSRPETSPPTGAWLRCAVLAHNLIRWTATTGAAQRRGATHRRPHRPSPPPRHARPARQPLRQTVLRAPPAGHGRTSSPNASPPSGPSPPSPADTRPAV